MQNWTLEPFQSTGSLTVLQQPPNNWKYFPKVWQSWAEMCSLELRLHRCCHTCIHNVIPRIISRPPGHWESSTLKGFPSSYEIQNLEGQTFKPGQLSTAPVMLGLLTYLASTTPAEDLLILFPQEHWVILLSTSFKCSNTSAQRDEKSRIHSHITHLTILTTLTNYKHMTPVHAERRNYKLSCLDGWNIFSNKKCLERDGIFSKEAHTQPRK